MKTGRQYSNLIKTGNSDDENSFAVPSKISPKESEFKIKGIYFNIISLLIL